MNIVGSLCEALIIEEKELRPFAATAPHRYKVYKIPKRNSDKTRTIAQPSRELKFIQKTLVQLLEPYLTVQDCAFAYREGLGIKDNAKRHLGSKYLLKIDFKNFFNSITPKLLFSLMEKYGFELSENEKTYLSNLLFWKPIRKGPLVLSVGAPSSPLISNFVMSEFDKRLLDECQKNGITYTRYADDLTFSTNKKNILFTMPKIVSEILKSETYGLININHRKTVFSSKAHNRHITGVTLSNQNRLSLGRYKKRLISSMIHKFSHDQLDHKEAMHLHGLLSHASHIEPAFFSRMEKKYGTKVISRLNNISFDHKK